MSSWLAEYLDQVGASSGFATAAGSAAMIESHDRRGAVDAPLRVVESTSGDQEIR